MAKDNICVIYDDDESYAKRLMGIINDSKDIPYRAKVFTKEEEFNRYILANKTDVLMVNEEQYTYGINHEDIKTDDNSVIVLCEDEKEAGIINDKKEKGLIGVCKYQPAYQLLGSITRQRPDRTQRVEDITRYIGVYGFNSTLRVTLAMVIAAAYSKKGRTLFINLDEFSGIEHIMMSDGCSNLSDVFYMFKQAGEHFTQQIRECIKANELFDYIPAVVCADDILSGEEQENVQNDKEQESVQADNECKYVRCGENLSEAQAYSEQFMEDNENLKKDLADMLEQSDDGDMQYEDRQKEQINTSLNAVWQLYEYLKSGICETVTEGRISNKYIEIQELADEYIKSRDISFINKDEIKRSIEASRNEDTLKKNVLSTEYVAKHFICYTDTSPGDNDRAGSSALLDYEMEYIIGGEHNDRKNVYKVINQLAVIREGVNLSYLISSQDKMSEAYMLAAALVGVTGCDLAVRLVQYIIVSIWAYAESIVELRKLLAGETIALIKNRDNWILQLSSLVDEKLNLQSLINNITSYEAVNNNKVEENGRDNGIGYKEYLKLLIMFMNKSDRNYRIAALMELRMIMYGHSGFRMKNYIYAAFGAAHFKMNGTGSVYRQKLSYSYI